MAKLQVNKFGTRYCSECRKRFQPKTHSHLTCSVKCNNIRALRKKREYYQKSKENIHYDPKPCVICKKEFTPKALRDVTCSHECSIKWRNIGIRRQTEMGGRKYPYDGKCDQAELDEFRRREGLPPLKRGTQKCLRCGKPFESNDLLREHMCSSCLTLAQHFYTEASARHIGGGIVRG